MTLERTLPLALAGCMQLAALFATAQVTFALRDISPTQSTLHAADADGASGGRVNGLGISSTGNTVYAASEHGGIWRSTDRGANWEPLTRHRPMVCWDVEVQPGHDDVVLATSFYDGLVASGSGLQRSVNGGTTWSKPATFVPPAGLCDQVRIDEPSAFGIAFDPAHPDHVFVGTNCGLARSTDGGATWTFVDPTPADLADDVWDVVVHHDGIVDIMGDDGHLRSIDGGATFTADPVASALGGGMSSITASPDEADVLVVTRGTSIFQTIDAGTTWSAMTNPRAQGRVPFVRSAARAGDAWDLWFGDVNLNRCSCATGGAGLRCPANSWTQIGSRSTGLHDDLGAIVFDPSVAEDACPVVVSSDGGVYRNALLSSPSCLSPAWTQPDRTPRGLWLFGMDGSELAGDGNEHLYFGCQDDGSFFTANAAANTVTWGNRDCCDGFDDSADPSRVLYTICCFNPPPGNRLFMRGPAMAGGGQHPSPPPGSIPGFKPIDAVAHVDGNRWVVLTSTGLFFTSDVTANPTTWTELGDAPAGASGVKKSVRAGTPEFIVQVGPASGGSADRLFRFAGTNAAGTWTEIARPNATGGFNVWDVDRDDPDRLIASYIASNTADPAMLLTTDGGTTWNAMPALDDRMTRGGAVRYRTRRGPTNFTSFGGYVQPSLVAFSPYDNDVIVAGGRDAGVFFSVNGGTTWTLASYPSLLFKGNVGSRLQFPFFQRPQVPRPWFAYFEKPVRGFTVNKHPIYIGTQGRGVWRLDLTERTGLVNICQRIPEICHVPDMIKDHIVFKADDLPFVVRDPLPKNCLVKFPCPGCEGVGLCPPWYQLFLYDVDPVQWDILLVDARGEAVPFELLPFGKGQVVSFRPTKKDYVEGKIADYELLMHMGKETGKRGTYKIRMELKAADRPYAPDPKLIDEEEGPPVKVPG